MLSRPFTYAYCWIHAFLCKRGLIKHYIFWAYEKNGRYFEACYYCGEEHMNA